MYTVACSGGICFLVVTGKDAHRLSWYYNQRQRICCAGLPATICANIYVQVYTTSALLYPISIA